GHVWWAQVPRCTERRMFGVAEMRQNRVPPMTIEQARDRLLDSGGSDLLISCGSPPRLRRDGRLEALNGESLTPAAVEPMLLALLDESQWRELTDNRNVDFAFTWRDRVRIRGN